MFRFMGALGAVVVGFIAGSLVNMGLIMVGGQVIAPPAGADLSTMEGLKAALPLFEPRHFVFPFLAHALGTLAGALVATLAAARLMPGGSTRPGWIVGVLFLLGGLANTLMLGGPLWFNALDLAAYLPAAWVGIRAAGQPTPPGRDE